MTEKSARELHQAVARTLGEGSARFHVVSKVSFGAHRVELVSNREDLAELTAPQRIAVQTVQLALSTVLMGFLALVALVGRAGRAPKFADAFAGKVDFTRRAYRRPGRRFDYLCVDGRRFVGGPGHWYELDEAAEVGFGSPLWYLEVLAAATDAHTAGHELVGNMRCQRLDSTCDFAAAAAQTRLKAPANVDGDELRRLPLRAWLDTDNRLRRIEYVERRADNDGTECHMLELSEFGVSVTLEPPLSDELTDVDPRGEVSHR